MYRPNNPRFNGPPVDNRGQRYDPKPRQRTQNNYRNVSPPEFKPFGPEINRWKSSFAETEENDKDKNAGNDKNSSPERKRFHLSDPHESRSRWDIDASQKQQGATTGRLSPPPPLHKFKQSPGCSGTSQMSPPSPEVKADPSRNELVPPMDLVNCDLCEVKLSNGQELEEHLDTKTHWDTLEYIKKQKKYDDMAIAFLQDVMIYKSRKSNRAIEDTALQALQEYDHMTKVEMFHCAACNTFVPTSALAVQNHITTEDHMTNTKEFEDRQKRLCPNKANTMMRELMPQFITFSQGASPFQ